MALLPAHVAELLKREGADPDIWLVTITGNQLGGAIRLARNPVAVVSRGLTFNAAYFQIDLPTDTENQPAARMTIPNIDRELGLALHDMTEGLTLTFEMIFASAPDVVVMRVAQLRLQTVSIDAMQITGLLSAARFDTEPYINLRVTPSAFPGLWLAR